MAETFTFELVSPEKLLVSKAVGMVTVPGSKGEYGVLQAHIPMITSLDAGVIRVYAEDGVTVTDKIFVSGGFAEVANGRFTVLATEAIPVGDMDHQALQDRMNELEAKISSAGEDEVEALLVSRNELAVRLYATM